LAEADAIQENQTDIGARPLHAPQLRDNGLYTMMQL